MSKCHVWKHWLGGSGVSSCHAFCSLKNWNFCHVIDDNFQWVILKTCVSSDLKPDKLVTDRCKGPLISQLRSSSETPTTCCHLHLEAPQAPWTQQPVLNWTHPFPSPNLLLLPCTFWLMVHLTKDQYKGINSSYGIYTSVSSRFLTFYL